jgi:hypothetical protein
LRIGPINGKFLKRYYAWYLMLLLATWAKIVKGKKKKKTKKWTTLWLDPLSIKVHRQLGICSKYSHTHTKKLFDKKNPLNYVMTWSFIHKDT